MKAAVPWLVPMVLLVACGIGPGGQVLGLLPVLKTHAPQFEFDLAVAHPNAVLFHEKPRQLLGFQVCPKHFAVGRAASLVPVYQGFQQNACLRGAGKIFFFRRQPAFGGPLESAPSVPGFSPLPLPCGWPLG